MVCASRVEGWTVEPLKGGGADVCSDDDCDVGENVGISGGGCEEAS